MADQGVAFDLAEAALAHHGRQRGGAGLSAVEHAGAPPPRARRRGLIS